MHNFNVPPVRPAERHPAGDPRHTMYQGSGGYEAPQATPENPEVQVQRLLGAAETFDAIRAALNLIPGIQRDEKTYYLQQELLDAVKGAETLCREGHFDALEHSFLGRITNGLGLRDAVKRTVLRERALAQQGAALPSTIPEMPAVPGMNRSEVLNDIRKPVAERLAQVQTFAELDRVLESVTAINTKDDHYSGFQIFAMVDRVRAAITMRNAEAIQQALGQTTSGEGLRAALARLANIAWNGGQV